MAVTVRKMVNSNPEIYQNNITYTQDSHTIMKDLTLTSLEPQKERKKKAGLKKYTSIVIMAEKFPTLANNTHAKMGTIKGRNGMDQTEAEDIKKRWQEYTEELYKKDLHDPHNHNGVITNLEPDILECEVKCALGSITTNKANGGDGIPLELFQILKDDAVKMLH